MNDTALAELLARFVDAKFYLGDAQKGWDCLSSLLAFYRAAGVVFPEKWGEYTEENYAEKWKENPDRARADFAAFLKSLGQKIENHRTVRPGDLLLFEGKAIPLFPAIYAGSGKMLMIFKEGGKIVPFNHFKAMLVEVRRLL